VRVRALSGFAAVGILLALVPSLRGILDFPLFYLIFLYFLFFWIAQASSWNILTGYSGYFSFGQGGFYGIGVYTTAVLSAKLGWPFLATLPLAGTLAALFGLLIGLVVFRLRKLKGEIFALITLAVAFVLAAVARVNTFVDGGAGVPLHSVDPPAFLGDFTPMIYRLGLVIAFLTVLTAYLIQHSRLGWGLFAIRDDEAVAEGLGVPTFGYKMAALGISSFFAGLSGGLHALQITYVTIGDVFNIRVPLFVILMSVLGGTRHWMGPIVGATVIFTLTDRLNSAGLEHVNQIIIGSLLIVMVVSVKEGIYLRLKARPWSSLAVFVAVLVVLSITLGGSLVTRLAYAMMTLLLLLLLPQRWLRWGRMRTSFMGRDIEPPPASADLETISSGGEERG
jgi:branched-chain amino acid transport system permease protein